MRLLSTDMIFEMDKEITGIGYSVNDQTNNERVSSGRGSDLTWHRRELNRVRSERQRYQTEYNTQKEEMDRLRKELESSLQGAKEEMIKLQNIIVSMENELDRLNVDWEKKLSA
jgi:SMC interacting uncharacterized protein involved in chromosome segregation